MNCCEIATKKQKVHANDKKKLNFNNITAYRVRINTKFIIYKNEVKKQIDVMEIILKVISVSIFSNKLKKKKE